MMSRLWSPGTCLHSDSYASHKKEPGNVGHRCERCVAEDTEIEIAGSSDSGQFACASAARSSFAALISAGSHSRAVSADGSLNPARSI
eukprot:2485644-Pleurochrysis_carterae.AAC.2